MGIKEEDLIKYLDAFMSGDGGLVKPMIDENGDVNFLTIRESAASQAANESLRSAEDAFGERMEREGSLFIDEADECPSCASIPNLGDSYDDEW